VRERRREYELMFIISPLHSSEEEINTITERISQTIDNNGGSVSNVDQSAPWGRRKLAYPIRDYAGGEASRRNFTEGYYVLMHFTLLTERVSELERTLRLTDSVLRHLVTLVDRKGRILSTDDSDANSDDRYDDDEDDDDYEDEDGNGENDYEDENDEEDQD
jgi:small subunit ribosomal protein S6